MLSLPSAFLRLLGGLVGEEGEEGIEGVGPFDWRAILASLKGLCDVLLVLLLLWVENFMRTS